MLPRQTPPPILFFDRRLVSCLTRSVWLSKVVTLKHQIINTSLLCTQRLHTRAMMIRGFSLPFISGYDGTTTFRCWRTFRIQSVLSFIHHPVPANPPVQWSAFLPSYTGSNRFKQHPHPFYGPRLLPSYSAPSSSTPGLGVSFAWIIKWSHSFRPQWTDLELPVSLPGRRTSGR